MDKVIKEKWIEALRSGKYKQGRGYLRSKDNEYCCLGVLCDVMNVTWREVNSAYSAYVCEDNEDYSVTTLSCFIREKAKIKNQTIYITLNDDLSKSFNEIADYIEIEE